MEKNRKILFATDFSPASESALEWTISIARELRAKIVILYAFRLLDTRNEGAVVTKKNAEHMAQLNFAKLERKILIGSQIPYEFRAEVGFPTDRVEANAQASTILFIVMDKSMFKGDAILFEEVRSKIQIPLMLIP